MDTEHMLKNKPMPEKLKGLIPSEFADEDSVLITVVGDLLPDGKYGDAAVLFTDSALCAVNSGSDRAVTVSYSDIEKIGVKRMYGNAIMSATLKDGSRVEIMRFTFSVAVFCESAVDFVRKVIDGEAVGDAIGAAHTTFKSLGSVCPKCGRRLPSHKSECLNCAGKKKLSATLFKYIRPHLGMLLVSLLLAALTTAASLVPPYITSQMVDSVIPEKDLRSLTFIIIALVGTYLFTTGVGGVRSYLLRITGNSIMADLKKEIYTKAQYLPMKFYDKTSTGAVINRVNSDTQVLQQFMMTITQSAIVNLFTMIGIIAIMMFMNWRLTLLSLIPVPFVVAFSKSLSKRLKPRYLRLWRRNTAISGMLSDTIPAIKVVKSFSREDDSVKKFAKNVDSFIEEDRKIGVISSILPAMVNFLIMCGTSIIWLVGGRMVINDPTELSLGVLVSFISYTSMFYAPVNFFAVLNDQYQSALASMERIFDILNAEPESDFGRGSHPENIKGKIEFRGINFSFDRSKKVLTDVNFVIEPGDVVGIVGTTGSGKSTLINLLLRFYEDYDGEILLDDINIKDIDLQYFRNQIGFVQQEAIMFRDTIYNNIAYSKPDATPDEVINVADIANAHGFISRLPDAYDTMLGERGVGLSGGEKQRLSIARAVLKNPSILIFDEATSAVDSETEKLIQDAIDNIVYGRTTLMIAHRLSTLRKANKIIVVDQGRIIEFGSPEELLAMKGKFYKLVNIQSMSEEAEKNRRAENFD